jgi:hypothetical protein
MVACVHLSSVRATASGLRVQPWGVDNRLFWRVCASILVPCWLLPVGEQHRLGRVVGHASGVEILDLRIHAVALADAGKPRPGIERLGAGP